MSSRIRAAPCRWQAVRAAIIFCSIMRDRGNLLERSCEPIEQTLGVDREIVGGAEESA